jgi:hypothetical protein
MVILCSGPRTRQLVLANFVMSLRNGQTTWCRPHGTTWCILYTGLPISLPTWGSPMGKQSCIWHVTLHLSSFMQSSGPPSYSYSHRLLCPLLSQIHCKVPSALGQVSHHVSAQGYKGDMCVLQGFWRQFRSFRTGPSAKAPLSHLHQAHQHVLSSLPGARVLSIN